MGAIQCRGSFGCHTHTHSNTYPIASLTYYMFPFYLPSVLSAITLLTILCSIRILDFYTQGRLRSGNVFGTTQEEGSGQESGNIGAYTRNPQGTLTRRPRMGTHSYHTGIDFSIIHVEKSMHSGIWRGPHDFINQHFGYSTLMSCLLVRS